MGFASGSAAIARPGDPAHCSSEGGAILNRSLHHLGLALAALTILAQSQVNAEPIIPGVTNFPIAAIQDVELLPGTPFNPSGSSILITDLTAVGSFSIDRAAQAGSTISYTGIDAYFTAASSPIGPFELGAGPTIGIGGFSGSITNVVQDPLDPGFSAGQPSSFVSGDFLADVSQFGLRVGGQLLFTKDPVEFTGHLDGLPPSLGTTLVSPDQVEVYWTNPLDGSDLLVAYSFDRRLVSVAEPSSLILLGLGLSSLAVWRRRCRRI
jgi:PEP-CTERM motif